MRSFIAISVPKEIKNYAFNIRQQLEPESSDVKWVEYENYHLTLKFLGDVRNEQVVAVKNKLFLAANDCSPFKLSLSTLGFFPHRSRPRVLWLGVKGEIDKAQFLGDRVDSYLVSIGFEADKKRSFHLTLGRIRSEYNQESLVEKVSHINQNIGNYQFVVDEFHFMESRLYSDGPVYKVNQTFKLSG